MRKTLFKTGLLFAIIFSVSNSQAQNVTECDLIVKNTVESVNTNSTKSLDPFLDANFSTAGYSGAIAKMIFSQLITGLKDKIVSFEKKSELKTNQGISLIYNFVYEKMGAKETTFEFSKENKLIKLDLFPVRVNVQKETINNNDNVDRSSSFDIPIDFSALNKAIFITVSLKGKKLNFLFDTGASATVINSKIVNELGLGTTGVTEVVGVSGASSSSIIKDQQITIEKTSFNETLIVQDLSKFQDYGLNIDGIIGATLFNKYILDVDIDKNVIHCMPVDFTLKTDGYKKIELEKKYGLTFINIEIEIANGQKFTGKVFFDSGALGATLLLNSNFNSMNKIESQLGKIYTSTQEDINTKISVKEAAIKSLKISDYSFQELPIRLLTGTGGVIDFDGFMGILGSDIIYRYNFILDVKSNALYLKPNSRFAEEFVYPTTGFEMIIKNNLLIVSKVDEKSDAYKKGIRKGSEIVSVNNLTDITAIKKELRKTNSKATIVFKQLNEQTKSIQLKLKRLI